MSRAFVSPGRQRWMTAVILGSFCALFGRLYDLHVVQRPHLQEVAEHRREVFQVVPAIRGDIYDSRGDRLATTRTIYELGVDPQMVLPGDLAKLPALAKLTGMPVEDLQKAFTTLKKDVDTADGIETHAIHWAVLNPGLEVSAYQQVAALKIKAVYGTPKYQRIYPGGQLAAHVLGYVNKEGIPEGGAESALNFYLNGQDGWLETEQDGHHHELEQFSNRDVKPTNGLNVELTIDSMLQYYAEQEVSNLVEKYQPAGVTIIMSDPSTGDILALANYPTYDPNHYGDYPMANLTNRALSDVFEPGSTFKVVTAAAALNEHLVQPEDRFDCSKPTLDYRGRTIKLPVDDEPNGVLSVSEIVSHSSNRGAANIGMKIGPAVLCNYASLFGFGKATGLFGTDPKTGHAVGGESGGVVQPLVNFDHDALLISRMPMGHGVDATAMQVHQAMSVVANHGILMEPRIVNRVFDNDNKPIVLFQPKAERRVISAETAEQLNAMLCNVVSTQGTAVRAGLADIKVAGKTGTAQKLIDGHYSTDHHVATFSGYLPADRPRLVITVIVDDAHMKGVAFGGLVSAPAFHNVAELAVQYLGIQPPGGRENLTAMKGDKLDWVR